MGHRTDGWQHAQWSRVLLSMCQRCLGCHFGCRKSNIRTPRLVVLIWTMKSATHTYTRRLNCGYVDIIAIVLFVLSAVASTQDGWWVCDINTKYLFPYLHSPFAADCACAVVRWVVGGVVRHDTVTCGGWNCCEPLERFIDIMERRQSNGGQQRHYPFRHPKWRYPYLEGPSTRPYTPTRSLLLQIHSHSNLANR